MIRGLIKAVVTGSLRLVPLAAFARATRFAIGRRLEGAAPDEALRLLLELDNFLYGECGRWAVAYGGGAHVKHRLTGYVSWFAELAATCGGPYLDIGCGNGELARAIAERAGEKVVGVDIVPARIEAARRLPGPDNLSFVQGDATVIDIEGAFPTLILSNVYEHIADRGAFLDGLCRRYAPARLLIRVPVFDRDWRVPLKRELGVEWRSDHTHEIEHTQEQFHREMADAGMRVAREEIHWGEIWAVVEPRQ